MRDPEIPTKSQQCVGTTYLYDSPDKYERGYVVMAEHMESMAESMYDSHYHNNIVPQAKFLNRDGGSWRLIEDTIECIRDDPVVQKQTSFGGMLYTWPLNDHFLDSHGIPTPKMFWYVMVRYFHNAMTVPDVSVMGRQSVCVIP